MFCDFASSACVNQQLKPAYNLGAFRLGLETTFQCHDTWSNVFYIDHAGAPKMQRVFTIAQRVRAVVPKHGSQVTYASLHSSVVNAAITDDVAKASANLKRKIHNK